jgi:hypothetical protein
MLINWGVPRVGGRFKKWDNIKQHISKWICVLLLSHILFVSTTHLHPFSPSNGSNLPTLKASPNNDSQSSIRSHDLLCLSCTLQRNLTLSYQDNGFLFTKPQLKPLDKFFNTKNLVATFSFSTIHYRGPPTT